MAVTTVKKEEQQQIQQPAAQTPAQPYTVLAGVSSNTAQRVGQAQQGYKASDAVNAAQQTWNQLQAQKPADYNSKYAPVLDNILQQIQNPSDFKYEFNGDNLFKSYADLYSQYAKQGMEDAMGQAAALTGGYGNSYAQTLGQQQYQQNMLPLYEKGLELRDRAYQAHQDNYNRLLQQYNVISDQENTDYGRYRDTVGDWMTQENQAYNRYQDAQNFDYTQYMNDLNYWTGLAQVENQVYQNELDRQEAIRQYNQDYALRKAQFEEDKRRYDQEWNAMMAAQSGGGGYNGTKKPDYYGIGGMVFDPKTGQQMTEDQYKGKTVDYTADRDVRNFVTTIGNSVADLFRKK